MSSRGNNTIDFVSIVYDDSNRDEDWEVEVRDSGTGLKDLVQTTALETALGSASSYGVMSDLLGSGLAPLTLGGTPQSPANRYNAGLSYAAPLGDKKTVVMAFRMPLVKNICELTMLDDGVKDLMTEVENVRIYISGRSDKSYHEITNWVKRFDTGIVAPINSDDNAADFDSSLTDENGFHSDLDDIRYPSSVNSVRNGNFKHGRFFRSRSAWVKVEIDLPGEKSLNLNMLGFHEYFGDVSDTDPEIEGVWPPNNQVYQPSESVYMTAKVSDNDGDNCHFRFELFKESNLNPTSLDGLDEETDIHVVTIQSNALNLDGTLNENYRRTYFTLLNEAPNARNTIHLSAKRSCDVILIKPKYEEGGPRQFKLADLVVYRAGSDTPFYTDSMSGGAIASKTVDLDSLDGNDHAWLVPIGSIQDVIKFDFVQASDSPIVDFEMRFATGAGGAAADPNDNSWNDSHKEDAWVANIEYCWPYDLTDNEDGYDYDSSSPIDSSNNPENNGKEGYATRIGKWRKVPPFSGLILSKKANGDGSYDVIDTTTGGDSPIQNVNGDADKVVYIRLSVPDPYQNQERYYFRPGVHDGQVKNI